METHDSASDAMLWWSNVGVRVDAVTVEVHLAFEAAGIPHVLLKGPSIAGWLYGIDELRAYGDSDFLVATRDWEPAGAVLAGLGFATDVDRRSHPGLSSLTSFPWERGDDDVDLHATLDGLEADPDGVWDVLTEGAGTERVLDAEVPVLSVAARTLHVILHAAKHHRFEERPREDLRRAIEQVPFETFREALAMAERLDGVAAFAAGLRLADGGLELAARLGDPSGATVSTRLREEWVPMAEGINALWDTPGLRGKLRVAFGEVFPRPDFMRWWTPVARRGRLWLALAYLWRPLWMLSRLPAAVRAVIRARKRP